ncbi:DUF4892 domain-containing protein [Pseudomonas sp. PDNC002]|uniref:OmpA family protein n=1 Tax=Pseudomonas sp. PDNC002 TaxID=2811422 RepID=UPI001963FAEE|nr:OmpA family protein [Pseudomonas sp. PDNC002]QRY80026.1 DUF4892 domain-containing protein [Pseudomonas sp. PDNC002]
MRYLLCSFALLGTMSAAQAADVEGSVDHPLIGRFAGAEIARYQQVDFDEVSLPKGKIGDLKNLPDDAVLKLEGRITAIDYRIPGQKSALEVLRNYQQATGAKGFETLFECQGYDECGDSVTNLLRRSGPAVNFDANIYSDSRLILSKRQASDGDSYLLLIARRNVDRGDTEVFQEVVDVQPMAQNQIKLEESSELKKNLDAAGRVAVYGVHFDSGKTEIKPESKATLEQIAKLLKDNPELKVYIVGHTDNTGSLDGNLDLSKRRADAVVQALGSGYGVAAERLAAYGVASLSPVASNTEETGRTLNRRVEIVLR